MDRALALIDDLLALAREGESVREITPGGLSDLIEECWGDVQTADATLRGEIDRAIHADPSRLQRLLENLFQNAVDHGGDDATVSIGESEEGFYIADDGTGIPEADHDRMFETGYTTAEGGTGFGLDIVRRVVEAHDWDITVTESDDGGARFEISGVDVTYE